MLKKWYYSNLLSRREKVHAQELVASVQGFPVGVMERFPVAIENDDMAGSMSMDKLANLMITDGFYEWGEARRTSDMPLSHEASNWTALRQLRHVIDSNIGSVLTTDRTFPIALYSVIDEILESCPANMKGLYLHWVADPDTDEYGKDHGYGKEHYQALAGLTPCGVPGILSNFKGSGWCVYFTPEGAQDFLEAWRVIPKMDRQSILIYTHYPVSGYYTCNPNLAMSVPILGKGIISYDNPVLVKDKRWN